MRVDTGGARQAATGAGAVELPAHLPARMLNEYVYCPRLFYYEWVEGVFQASHDTVEGKLRHDKLGGGRDPMPPPDAEGPIHSRSVQLASDTYGLVASIDLVEGEAGQVMPVDYKKGSPRSGPEGPLVWPSDRVQVVVQALLLRDAGYRCDEAIVYYHGTRQRVRVAVDDAAVMAALEAAHAARETALRGRIPPPLVDSPKCPGCSLVGICLPDETRFTETLRPEPDPQLSLFEELAPPEPVPGFEEVLRRLVPARDDLRPLYVTGHDLTVGKSGEVLRITRKGQPVQEVRLCEISQVNMFGSAQLTTPAIHELCTAEKPIAYFSQGGWFYGFTHGLGLKNVFLRRDQFEKAGNDFFCTLVAREVVASKIANQRTMVQRNHVEPPALVLRRLKELSESAAACNDRQSLLGIEGTAARLYFEALPGMIKCDDPGADTPAAGAGEAMTFRFEERNRRPPRDPVNALLSLAYALLVKDLTIVCESVGFDPFLGFYHQPRFGRPALALDLMEGFRPLIADSVVLTAINRRMVDTEDFIRAGPAVSLNPKARKALLHAYEQRMDSLVTHPRFGYRVSYRRVLEIQTRLLARAVTGEIARYPGFETR